MPSLSDTQLIRTHGVHALRIPNNPKAPLHLLGEQETLFPFLPPGPHATVTAIAVPKELWKGKRVLIAPGYGNLPFQLLCLGAQEIIGIDVDPVTIAYQRKKVELGAFVDGDIRLSCITTPRSRMPLLDQLTYKLNQQVEKPEEPLGGISFTVHDVCRPLDSSFGKFSLIVVPYLVGIHNGVKDEAAKVALENLAATLTPDGAMLILPAAYWNPDGTMVCHPAIDAFVAQHSYKASYSPGYRFSMIANSPGTVASYALLSPRKNS